MSAVPMAGTGRGPRPDPTTFTRRAAERTERTNRTDEPTDGTDEPTDQFTDNATTE